MKLIKSYTIAFIIILIATSCEQEVTVSLPNAEARLVVDGRIELIDGKVGHNQVITLSTLNDYFEQTQTPRVTDANVTVTDSRGGVFVFLHNGSVPGSYENNVITPVVGETYTLKITWNGEVFEASEQLAPVSSIDSIYQKFEEENQYEDAGIKVAIDFTDPGNQENYYFWEVYQNGENAIIADPGNSLNIISTDKFFNGQQIIGYFPSEEKIFDPGDEAAVRHIGLSKAQYDYMYILLEQTGQTGQLFDVPAAPIRGNVRNLTNVNKPALGYFGAGQVDERSIVIQPN
jgi:hypothetical protein